MKQFFTSKYIYIAGGTVLSVAAMWFMSSLNQVATAFVVIALCTAVAAGAFLTWAIRSLLSWRQARL